MMEIEDIIAEKIIARTKGLIPYDINVMNKKGIVVASTDASRMGLVHKGASWVIEHQQVLTVDHASTRYLAGAKPGVNLPIEYQGNCIGVVGITGDPERVCELGALLKMTAELLVEQSREKDAALLLSVEKENYLKRLVTGQLDDATAKAGLKRLPLTFRYPALCVTLTPHSPAHCYQQKLDLTPTLELSVNGLFFFSQESGLTLILEAKSTLNAKIAQVASLLAQPLTIGVGCAVASLSGLALSYATATAALQFGLPEQACELPTPAAHQTAWYSYDSHKEKIIISSLAQGWHLDELTKEYRALTAQDPHGALRLTLQTLMSSSVDMTTCAHRLNIHRNTLRNRLDKIQQITGVDYKQLDQLFRLYLGKIILD
ncbi:CdaR family transcriptional regulator [Oceanisphaera ostreae]|uniref:CdaR family transcriptional regulator n=1 Tax=Oceanisphaera ostreae TaxID=914151 RepID=A0ABW3KDM7_9GAMM